MKAVFIVVEIMKINNKYCESMIISIIIQTITQTNKSIIQSIRPYGHMLGKWLIIVCLRL